MAFIEKTLFEVKNSNSRNNQEQTVAGKFGTGTGSGFTPNDCSAGFLCVRNGEMPCEGYESITNPRYNGNTYYFNAATNGNSGGRLGDRTGIYAFNNYNVNQVANGDLKYNIGIKTLGLGLPAGEYGDFTELIVGEKYAFGLGNFATGYAPSTGTTTGYATIANGLLSFSAEKPGANSGVYFKVIRADNVNEGNIYAGLAYICEVCRAEAVELPEVTTSDNGKVLTVVAGKWDDAALPE